MKNNSTIAAIATGQTAGGIGVVRISGDEALNVADRVFKASSGITLAISEGYRAYHGHVKDKDGWSDEAVVVVYKAPKSYTGEDVAEICCHGGLTTTRLTLRACIDAGASPAMPGEFTRRAFENGKLSLTQAEAVMSIISAEGKQAAMAAMAAHNGSLARRIEGITSGLLELSVKLSAWCDYPDEEEVPAVTKQEITDSLGVSIEKLEKLLSTADSGKLLREGIDTVICGKPNVGKSTLMNLLAGCERSIVTDIPGTTRDVVEEKIILGDCVLRLSDTAGLRDTMDTIEKIGVDIAKKRLEQCDLVLCVFDGSQKLDDDDSAIIDEVREKPCVAVINKTDKKQVIDSSYIKKKIPNTVYISAQSGDGIAELSRAVMEVTRLNRLEPDAGMIFNQRQQECAARSLEAAKEAFEAAVCGMTFDAVNVLISDAISCLLEMSGEHVTDKIVDGVFAQFCLGK